MNSKGKSLRKESKTNLMRWAGLSAAVAGLGAISRVTHDLEELVATLRVVGQPVTAEVMETLRTGVAQLSSTSRLMRQTSLPDALSMATTNDFSPLSSSHSTITSVPWSSGWSA